MFAANMQYKAYIVDMTAVRANRGLYKQLANVHFTSLCGLTYASSILLSAQGSGTKYMQVVPVVLPPSETTLNIVQHNFHKLLATAHDYTVVMTATCDGACLRQVTKTMDTRSKMSAYISCSDSGSDECRSQSFVYSSAMFTSGATPDAGGSNDDGAAPDDTAGGGSGSQSTLVVVGIIFVVLTVLVGGAVGWYYYRAAVAGREREYDITMTDSSHGGGSSSLGWGGKITEMVGTGSTASPFHSGGAAGGTSSQISFPSDRPRSADPNTAASNSITDMFATAAAGVSNFIGNFGSNDQSVHRANSASASAHGVVKSFGEISVSRPSTSGSSGNNSSPTKGKGLFGSASSALAALNKSASGGGGGGGGAGTSSSSAGKPKTYSIVGDDDEDDEETEVHL